MVNGVRGLCNGIGPALFGFTFYLFNVDIGYTIPISLSKVISNTSTMKINVKSIYSSTLSRDIPGPPFLFGALLATIALMFSLLLPNSKIELDTIDNDAKTNEQKLRILSIDEEAIENNQSD
jgi:hypothetical protein